MKPRKIRGELKDLVAQDLAAGKPRKQICQERSVTYQQISQEFGHVWKRGAAIKFVAGEEMTTVGNKRISVEGEKHEWDVTAESQKQ